MAEMVGTNGKVIAADLQEGMLQRLAAKLKGTKIPLRHETLVQQLIFFHLVSI